MAPENKLGIGSSVELTHEEELLTKRRALDLYNNELLSAFEVGTFNGLAKIHGFLFQDAYDFTGKMRTVNIAKGGDRQVYTKGIDASYSYEAYNTYSMETLS